MDKDVQLAEDMASENPAVWADIRQIKLQSGIWSYEGRAYMKQPMEWSFLNRIAKAPRRKCSMKATQGGFSELEINESLHGLMHGHYPKGILYLFPTTDDMREFSKSRFGPLISDNPSAIGQYVKDTDTASLKRVGEGFLYLRGASLTTHMEVGGKESSKLRGIPVDKIVLDEYDLMEEEVVGKARGRMGDSRIKQEVYVSNPTTPDRGIATTWKKSDQRHWFRYCDCGGWTCAELEFQNDPEKIVRRDENGNGYIACVKCGKPTNLNVGDWIPAERANSEYMWGYHWSQLSSATNDPWELLEEFRDPPEGNLADVMRMRLGLPFVYAEDKLTVGQVLACCGPMPQMTSHTGPCAMGVDVRRHKNVVIGIRTGRERFQILRVARLESWQDIHQLARRFNVRSAVIDIRPYEDSAREFQKKARFKTWLCEYSESTPVGTQYHDKTGIVKVNRTEILDATHRLVVNDGMLTIPANCPEVKQFAIECSSIAKVEEINRRTKQPIFRYHKLDTAPDDYRHALNYFYLAASGGKVATVRQGDRKKRPTHAKNDYVRC